MRETADIAGFFGAREPAASWRAGAVDADEEASVEEHLVSLLAPGSFEAEQYRALRHVVEDSRRTRVLTVVAVSSPGDGEGNGDDRPSSGYYGYYGARGGFPEGPARS